MNSAVPDPPCPSNALPDYLAGRREHLLEAWRAAVAADQDLTSPDDLSRSEFRDHIPQVLIEFEGALRQESSQSTVNHEIPDAEGSAEHGKHRWKQGYDLREVILEWGHLQRCLLNELEAACLALPTLSAEVFYGALRSLVNLVNNAIADSSEQYALLQQKQAVAERNALESAVTRFTEDGQRRATLWRESSHDLRGQLSIITSATALMETPGLDEALRTESLDMMQKGTRSLKEMLTSMLEDTQTAAIREECQLGAFDGATLLGGLCAASQPLARERRLILRSKGPESLPVEGDSSKVQRIAQNLVLNALYYTREGGVTVSWRAEDATWWSFQVQDTGPGLPAQDSGVDGREARQSGGEGIGLAIVRRLSESLGARMHTETLVGVGTTFTVILPREYLA